MVNNFANSFWVRHNEETKVKRKCISQQSCYFFIFKNEEVGTFDGWESIVQRLKSGRAVIKQYAEYLKQRYVFMHVRYYYPLSNNRLW